MSTINGIRKWVEETIGELVPNERPGFRFRRASSEEPLENSLASAGFMRAFQIRFNRDFDRPVTYLPLERTQTLVIRIAYLGYQDDDEMERLIDSDEELIARTLLQPSTNGWPAGLFNIDHMGSGTPVDMGEEEKNAVVIEHNYEIYYRCDPV